MRGIFAIPAEYSMTNLAVSFLIALISVLFMEIAKAISYSKVKKLRAENRLDI